ncbi:MAG TPA: hypothetical protein VFA52_01600 [Candidatus Paceibacterota bacterium]|nr:hypothetical protein [Candidatus Paceibacterota bacterium]
MSLSKMTHTKRQQGGFLQIILVLVIALVILHYLNISLLELLSKKSVHDFFVYVWDLTKIIWQDFLLLLNFIRGIVQGH